ncbi:MAG: SPOR domain-containing protein [Solirubrobacterales bacterium]
MSEEVVNWAVVRESEEDARKLADKLKAAGHNARITGAHTLVEMRVDVEGGADAAREEARKILDSVSDTWSEAVHAPKIALSSD